MQLTKGEIIYFSGKLKAEFFPSINDNFEKYMHLKRNEKIKTGVSKT